MGNASSRATSASGKFRQAKAATNDPAMQLIAEGLQSLADAVRDLDDELGRIDQGVRSLRSR
jgi:hypothetical protein